MANSSALQDALSKILKQLSHLDLSGKIIQNDVRVKAGGGSCDIFQGRSSVDGKTVAIRRIRVHLYDDLEFAKVRERIYTTSVSSIPDTALMRNFRELQESCGFGAVFTTDMFCRFWDSSSVTAPSRN